jgi:hypothetical protein
MVDLTSSDSDEGDLQFNGMFFLNAPSEGNPETGYFYDFSGYKARYTYKAAMEKLYGKDILTLNDSDFEIPKTDSQEPTGDSTNKETVTESTISESSSGENETETSNEPIKEDSKVWDSFDEKVDTAIEIASVVNVDFNGTDTIPAKVISLIGEKNVIMAVKVDKNTLVAIDGSKLTPAKASDVKLISSKNADGSVTIGVRNPNADIEKSIVIFKNIGVDKVGSSITLYFENADKSLLEFRTSPVYDNGYAAFEVPFVNANYIM